MGLGNERLGIVVLGKRIDGKTHQTSFIKSKVVFVQLKL